MTTGKYNYYYEAADKAGKSNSKCIAASQNGYNWMTCQGRNTEKCASHSSDDECTNDNLCTLLKVDNQQQCVDKNQLECTEIFNNSSGLMCTNYLVEKIVRKVSMTRELANSGQNTWISPIIIAIILTTIA